MAINENSMILSGVAQNVYDSFLEAKNDAVKGKLLFARVSGLTSGYDVYGNLQTNDPDSGCSKTYVFLGKKCYGAFPQLPLELINALGINVSEAQSGTIDGASYFVDTPLSGSTTIIEAIQGLANNIGIQSSAHTIVVTDNSGTTNLDVNLDNATLSANPNDGTVFANIKVSAITDDDSHLGGGKVTTYSLVDGRGRVLGDVIKTIDDAFLKSVEVTEESGAKGLEFVWYVRDESGSGVSSATTWVSLADLNNYKGGDGIVISDDYGKDTINIDLVQSFDNILTFRINGENEAQLYASAVTSVTVNGSTYKEEGVDLGTVISGISGTIGGTAYSAVVDEDGFATINVGISANGITFDSSNTSGVVPAISGNNVQSVIEEIVEVISSTTDNTISGLSAISASTDASGNTEICLTLNPSNTTSNNGDEIISSEEGATAVSPDATNAVKMSQDAVNGLFVYIEVDGNDLDDEEELNEMYYSSTEDDSTSSALGISATQIND